MTLAEARSNIGQRVLYHPPSGGEGQRGVIAGADHTFVYVRYGNDTRPRGTSPDQLTLITPEN